MSGYYWGWRVGLLWEERVQWSYLLRDINALAAFLSALHCKCCSNIEYTANKLPGHEH